MSRRTPPESWSAHAVGGAGSGGDEPPRSPAARRAPFRTMPSPRTRGRARNASAISEAAAEPTLPLALAELWDLRRLGLFDDDGRAPPSWWER